MEFITNLNIDDLDLESKVKYTWKKLDFNYSAIVVDSTDLTIPFELIFPSERPSIIPNNDSDIPDQEWYQAASSNPAFDFLNDPAEDIYSPSDGNPFDDER
jgi:hypothetical protein